MSITSYSAFFYFLALFLCLLPAATVTEQTSISPPCPFLTPSIRPFSPDRSASSSSSILFSASLPLPLSLSHHYFSCPSHTSLCLHYSWGGQFIFCVMALKFHNNLSAYYNSGGLTEQYTSAPLFVSVFRLGSVFRPSRGILGQSW